MLLLARPKRALSKSVTTDINLDFQPCDTGLRAAFKLKYFMKQQFQNIKHDLEVQDRQTPLITTHPRVCEQRCTFLWQLLWLVIEFEYWCLG